MPNSELAKITGGHRKVIGWRQPWVSQWGEMRALRNKMLQCTDGMRGRWVSHRRSRGGIRLKGFASRNKWNLRSCSPQRILNHCFARFRASHSRSCETRLQKVARSSCRRDSHNDTLVWDRT